MSQGTRKRVGREGCDRREEILDASTRLFAEHGYSETDTQLLADTLGVGKGTIYRYFPSKRELFLAAADRGMRKLNEAVEAAIEGVEDPFERIKAGAMGYVGFFRDHPEYVELLIQERAQFKDRERPTYFEHRERNIARWRLLYGDLMHEGRLREMPVGRVTDVMTAALYGAMFLNYVGGVASQFQVRAEEIVDIFLRGLLSDAERERRGEALKGSGIPARLGTNTAVAAGGREES